jgi:hypothetical protein
VLPSPPARLRSAALARPVGLALLGLALAEPALALGVTVGRPYERSGHVWVDVRVSEPFDVRVTESLEKGVPATLQLRAELWRRRTAWFDRMERGFDATIRIRHEVWRKTYRLERAGTEPATFGALDSVRIALDGPLAFPVVQLIDVRAGPKYYVVLTVTLKPLRAEDVEEVEDWLSGGARSDGSSIGVVTELPAAVFDAVRGMAGFGDQRARAVTPDFDLRQLLEPR